MDAEREGAMARCSETGQRVWEQRGGGSEWARIGLWTGGGMKIQAESRLV